MADLKITDLTALTTPADGDVFPIVDISDTTSGSTGTTKKIAMSSIFPSSATDNAIVRFDGTTGKLVQNSVLIINDTTSAVTINPKNSSDATALVMNVQGGSPASGSNGNGGNAALIGRSGDGTGAGGLAIVIGGAGGTTSGNGGNTYNIGGDTTSGSGGSVFLIPGSQGGTGTSPGYVRLYPYNNAPYYAQLVTSSIASSVKEYTFPNATGVLGVVVTKTDTGDPAGIEGLFEINTFDNKFKVYADGAWRQLATW